MKGGNDTDNEINDLLKQNLTQEEIEKFENVYKDTEKNTNRFVVPSNYTDGIHNMKGLVKEFNIRFEKVKKENDFKTLIEEPIKSMMKSYILKKSRDDELKLCVFIFNKLKKLVPSNQTGGKRKSKRSRNTKISRKNKNKSKSRKNA